MTAMALLFTLSAIGISETVYLIKSRKNHDTPICPIGGGCTQVLNSKYNHIFFISNDLLGLLGYIAMSLLTALLVLEVGPQKIIGGIFKLMILGASLLSLYFTYLQSRVIRAWCFWCLMSACTIWLMAIIIIFSKSI